jgi:exopolyphosphatase/guanosine-5'-triphosphate,3'-diphosphate pyrophosphatase
MTGLYGACDLGSNTFRLILARPRADGGGPDPATKRVWQEIPRISEGLLEGEAFQEAPLARAWTALKSFAETVALEGPERVVAGATMAARIASDGEAFVGAIAERFGWECRVLRGDEEARLGATGALAGFPGLSRTTVVFDVGGRSTEFAVARDGALSALKSLPVGVVGLKEAFIRHDPPLASELRALEARVRDALADAPAFPEGEGPPALIGTAGTVTTLAAMLLGLPSYDPEKVHGAAAGREAVERLYREVAAQPVSERLQRPGLHPMRADVIAGGLALVLGIMDRYGAGSITASDDGLLEGLWMVSAGLASLELG